MIKKAVITAAGKGTRLYPATNAVQKELFPLMDPDGIVKPVIQMIAEQAVESGIEEICIVVNPGEAEQFRRHFTGLTASENSAFRKKGKTWALKQSERLEDLRRRIVYVEQNEQHGFGHAVWCARSFTEGAPFLLLLGDHVYVTDMKRSCIGQALQGFDLMKTTLLPVTQTPVEDLHLFGTLAGVPIEQHRRMYRVREIIEKPDKETARKQLVTPGLPEGRFFTFFGMYALSASVMQILDTHIQKNVRSGGEIQLTSALQELVGSEGACALEIQGQRLDMGTPGGYIETQTVLARRGSFFHKA